MLFHNSDIGLSNYVSQKDIPVDRPDAAEDENSFASSMFSEKLVQPELNLAVEPTSTTDHESLNHENSSVGNRLLNSHSSTMRDSDSHVNMDGILMQSERMLLTPIAVATDEAGSSEGEYENEGQDSNIHQANSSLHHSPCRNRTGKSSLVGTSCSQPLELVESESQESKYSNSAKASVLDSISPKLTECNSEKSGNLSTRSSNTNKPNEFLESSTSNCFVALVKCSSPLEILSNQTLPGTADCHQSASCFRKSSAFTSANNYHDFSSNDDMMLATCHSCCSHRCTNRNCDEDEVKPVLCSSTDQLSQHDFHPAIKLVDFSRESQHNGVVIKSEPPSVFSAAGDSSNNFLSNQHQVVKKCEEVFSENVPSFSPASSEMSTTCDKNCGNRHNSICDSPVPHCVNNIQSPESESHSYPLRSRLRQTFLRQQWEALQAAPKSFGQLPTEVMFRIIHYLSINK
ncbi:unnamed protein product [Trichobilharzia szidati]|nr:unnamed protein product [Trichobilharzia szidati]